MATFRLASHEEATHFIEVRRSESPRVPGEDLTEWLSTNNITKLIYAWFDSVGLEDSNPDTWALVVSVEERLQGGYTPPAESLSICLV